MFRRLAFVVVLVCTGCSASGSGPATTEPAVEPAEATTAPAETTTTEQTAPIDETTSTSTHIPSELDAFETTTIELDGDVLLVAVADTVDLCRRGLMHVDDLGGLDGMLFVFQAETTGGFWMKDTLIPLDIAFFDRDGEFVDGFTMEPCTSAECPTYRPDGSYLVALEMPEGRMPDNVERLNW